MSETPTGCITLRQSASFLKLVGSTRHVAAVDGRSGMGRLETSRAIVTGDGRFAPSQEEASKIIIGRYEGTTYPEENGYAGAIELGTDSKGGWQDSDLVFATSVGTPVDAANVRR
jgi:hypothetical protein